MQTCIWPSNSLSLQIGFTFLVPSYLGGSRQRAVRRLYVCVCPRTRHSAPLGRRLALLSVLCIQFNSLLCLKLNVCVCVCLKLFKFS